jgi:hippurate hydrolase
MVYDGLYSKHDVPKPEYLIGMHTAHLPTGSVVISAGVLMAGTEQLDVTFYGQSAHGSAPQFSKDAGLMAAYAIAQYQAIIARVLDPRDPCVITVGAIHAGVENNTIPGMAELILNFRFFDEGKSFPFVNHQSTYQVDLNAIPYGSKIATMAVLDLLAK